MNVHYEWFIFGLNKFMVALLVIYMVVIIILKLLQLFYPPDSTSNDAENEIDVLPQQNKCQYCSSPINWLEARGHCTYCGAPL